MQPPPRCKSPAGEQDAGTRLAKSTSVDTVYMHDLQGGWIAERQLARPLLKLQLITTCCEEWTGCWSDVVVPSLTQL
jgi:hypothetical protein